MSRDWVAKAKRESAYDKSPKQAKRRAARMRARRLVAKSGTVLTGKDVAHKDNNPLNNSKSNLLVQSKKKNRGWRKGKH